MKTLKDTVQHLKNAEPIGLLTYLEMSETPAYGDQYAEISLTPKQTVIHLQSYRVSSTIPATLSKDLADLHGIDSEAMAINALNNEIDMQTDKEIIQLYDLLGRMHYEQTWSTTQRMLHKWLGFVPRVNCDTASGLPGKLFKYSSMIAHDTRTGYANFAILSKEDASLLTESPIFVFNENTEWVGLDGDYRSNSLCEKIGLLRNIHIFSTYNLRRGEVILGSSTTPNETGVYYVENESSISSLVEANTMNKKIQLEKRYTIVNLGEKTSKYFSFQISEKRYTFFTFIWEKLKRKK